MRAFLVCLHDATPAWAPETDAIVRDLVPLVGRRIVAGVVPDWHGAWPLAAHADFRDLLQEHCEELLLHGYFHRRQRGWGLTTCLTGGADEMNGLDPDETRRTIDRGQQVFTELFGTPARGFLAPAWQRGHVCLNAWNTSGLDHVLGFFAIDSRFGRRVPLATWTWDVGRWAWLGHVGHQLGRLSQALDRGVPTLAIHPRDVVSGFWPKILGVTRALRDDGYEPATVSGLLAAIRC